MDAVGTKLVFLDCDGVISPMGGQLFSPPHMARLRRIVTATGAKIVLSTSWRTSEFGRQEVAKHLINNSMPTFIGCTPSLPSASRSREILHWVEAHKEELKIVNFVALDDIHLAALAPDRAFFSKHAVCTNSSTGLTDAEADVAIQLLQDSNNF